MRSALMMAGLGLAALAGGCTTTGGAVPVDVTRYHLGAEVSRGTISVEPGSGADAVSIEYQGYLDAIRTELLAQGFSDPAPGATAHYVASVSLRRQARGSVQSPSPFQIGLGGGGFGGGGGRRGGGTSIGLGGGVSFPIGKGKTRDIVQSELAVQIRSRADGAAVWEGRAVSERLEDGPAGGSLPAARLASALFRGFPGESGITTTVK